MKARAMNARRTYAVCSAATACALALVLACAAALATPRAADAARLQEGADEFEVSVQTDVLAAVDPDAELCDVAIHVADDAGDHVGAARVDVAAVPPNAAEENGVSGAGADAVLQTTTVVSADGAAGGSHAVSASGTTSSDGRVLLPNAAVGATYKVLAVKDGHEEYEGRFVCAGSEGETWEVVLNRIPDPVTPDPDPVPDPDPKPVSLPSADGSQDADRVIKPLPWLSVTGDALLPLALGSLALLIAAGIVAFWSRRAGKEGERHDG